MTVFYEFDDVDMFTVGTVGRPGSRTFFLHVRADGLRLGIKCEKQQAAAIAQYLDKALSDLPPAEDRPIAGAMEISEPGEIAFVLGPIGLGYDRSNDRVLLQLEEVAALDEEGEPVDDDDRSHVRIYITRGQAAAFAVHAGNVIESGRPECKWCGFPIDPDGHPCPRMN
ncbi:MAG: DUF3090 family protein [Ilumatobacter sp.]|jgi:uncharacterized repeat protein (TIGR03847 family)|uniref:DUF3090 family protein n=1 Tax=Ilumatobacter sp. TaxID=1967498 RepID=UPI00391DA09E